MFTIKHGRVAFASKMLSTWLKVVKTRTVPVRLRRFTTVCDFTIVKTQKKKYPTVTTVFTLYNRIYLYKYMRIICIHTDVIYIYILYTIHA